MLDACGCALQVIQSQGLTVNNANNPITSVFSPTVKPLTPANNNANAAGNANAPGSAASAPGSSNAQAPGNANARAPGSSNAQAPGSAAQAPSNGQVSLSDFPPTQLHGV